jgi:hypothetical protein
MLKGLNNSESVNSLAVKKSTEERRTQRAELLKVKSLSDICSPSKLYIPFLLLLIILLLLLPIIIIIIM